MHEVIRTSECAGAANRRLETRRKVWYSCSWLVFLVPATAPSLDTPILYCRSEPGTRASANTTSFNE